MIGLRFNEIAPWSISQSQYLTLIIGDKSAHNITRNSTDADLNFPIILNTMMRDPTQQLISSIQLPFKEINPNQPLDIEPSSLANYSIGLLNDLSAEGSWMVQLIQGVSEGMQTIVTFGDGV